MSLSQLMLVRFIVPAALILLYAKLLGAMTGLWSTTLPDFEKSSYLPIIIIPAVIYYVTPLRKWTNAHHHNRIVDRLRVGLVQIAGYPDREDRYTWKKLRPLFYSLVDSDESLKQKASLAYANGAMRDGIIAHDVFLDDSNLQLIDGLDFVFLCMDRGTAKRAIVNRLIANGTSFADLGMGVVIAAGRLGGIVRVTTSTREARTEAAPHISFSDDDGQGNEYATNIQIPELNALNAAFAVIRWKKMFGIYQDAREDFYSGYSIPSGEIVAEGKL